MPKHVLIVDDERHVVKLLQINLLRQGYIVTSASSAVEAALEIDRQQPDLIVLDALLRDSAELISNLKSYARTRYIRVLTLSHDSSGLSFGNVGAQWYFDGEDDDDSNATLQ